MKLHLSSLSNKCKWVLSAVIKLSLCSHHSTVHWYIQKQETSWTFYNSSHSMPERSEVTDPFWPMHHFFYFPFPFIKMGEADILFRESNVHQWLLYVLACSVSESGFGGFTASRKGERWLDWWRVTYLKGFSPVCVRMWLLSVVAPANARPQYPHLNGLSLEWVTTWFLKSDGWEKDWEQWPHWYGLTERGRQQQVRKKLEEISVQKYL